jgi:membrane protease YdiL (CAAX protease family)
MSWGFPWQKIQFHSTISVTYLFDFVFAASVFMLTKKKHIFGKLELSGTLIRSAAVLAVAICCVLFIKGVGLLTPFKFIEHQVFQLLLFAPLLEEAVFRGAFYEAFYKVHLKPDIIIMLNTILFSFSHVTGYWFLPGEFHGFITFQIFYTLILGWICSKSRFKTYGILEPILLHFLFNLVFYIGVQFFGI